MITKQALGSTLFGMADVLRDKVEDYKAYILSLLFFKRLSDNYEWENKNAVAEFEKEQDRLPTAKEEAVIYKKKHDFKIPEGCFWKDAREATIDKKNEAIAELYEKFRQGILQLADEIEIKPKKMEIGFRKDSKVFADICILKNSLKIWINLKKGKLDDPKKLAEDVSEKGHWGNGDYQIQVDTDKAWSIS